MKQNLYPSTFACKVYISAIDLASTYFVATDVQVLLFVQRRASGDSEPDTQCAGGAATPAKML